jgi:hypothetical protein
MRKKNEFCFEGFNDHSFTRGEKEHSNSQIFAFDFQYVGKNYIER